jgi:hypothetical protein
MILFNSQKSSRILRQHFHYRERPTWLKARESARLARYYAVWYKIQCTISVSSNRFCKIQSIDNCHYRLIFYVGKKKYIPWKNMQKFANFLYFCIACGNCCHIWVENGSNFRTQYTSIQNLQTLQGYIFRILQHFANRLCNFTHFSMLFLAVMIYLRLLA